MTAQTVPARGGIRTWTPAQRFALIFGAVYVVVGLAGFAVTGLHDFTGMHHDKLVIFSVNPAHNVIHLALGLAWLAAAPHHRAAKAVNLIIGVVLALVGVRGLSGGITIWGLWGRAARDNSLPRATAPRALYFVSRAGGAPAESEPA